ncbi:transposase [Ensifer sp. 4252]|uniref:transposase n=1 Tax=Ensifer sp. 4252 TaxID=3373915 RepID=UPI003D22A53F
MADENAMESIVPVVDGNAPVKAARKQNNSPRQAKAAGVKRQVPQETSEKKAPAKARLTEQEKLAKLKLIEEQVSGGKTKIKDAIKSAGISEQTYYQWKRTVMPVAETKDEPSSGGDDLANLIQLESENQRLRVLLAEKLRAENAELKKRLGLA